MDYWKQHILPQGYLGAWADPAAPKGRAGCVHLFRKDAPSRSKMRSPANYFWEADRYTVIENGQRVLNVEFALGIVEHDFGEVVKALERGEPLDAERRVPLLFFVAAMRTRTKRYAERAGTMLRGLQAQAARLAAKDGRHSALAKGAEESLGRLNAECVSLGMSEHAEILLRMNLCVLTTDDEAGFVTGDEPCVECVPGEVWAYLNHPEVELTLPLTPRHLALYTWKPAYKMYTKLNRIGVDRINERTIGHCREEFVSWKGIVRDSWFRPRAA